MQAGSLSSDVPPDKTQQSQPTVAEAVDTSRQSDSAHELAAGSGAVAQQREQPAKNSSLKHINFWHEDELKTAHPEVKVY